MSKSKTTNKKKTREEKMANLMRTMHGGTEMKREKHTRDCECVMCEMQDNQVECVYCNESPCICEEESK